jgi:type 1 glutamine amidotransferase
MKRAIVGLIALIAIGAACVWAYSSQAPATEKEIVFVAGPPDHGMKGGPGHQYERDLRLLAYCLESSPNLKGIKTRVVVGKVPPASELTNAAAIVIDSSGDWMENEVHPLFPPFPKTNHKVYDAETTAQLKAIDDLTKKGMGVVVFHYSMFVDHFVARRYFLDWLGGLWIQIPSKNPFDKWTMTRMAASHPINRGVKDWSYTEEIFCNFFLPRDPRRTDLLLGTPGRNAAVGPQVAAFAFQREDGHRGFVMGGVHQHSNLALDDNRRFLLNGIVWAAGMEVPPQGVESSVTEELMKQ